MKALKAFWGITKKFENKNLNYFFLFVRDWDRKDQYSTSNQFDFCFLDILYLKKEVRLWG